MDWFPDDPRTCLRLADAVVTLHFCVVAFIVGGELAILAGGLAGWSWVRNRWFRIAHLGRMVLVAAQSAFGVLCPLTTLENDLRLRAGRPLDQASFIGRWLHELLFVEVDLALSKSTRVSLRWRNAASPHAPEHLVVALVFI